MDKQTTNNLTSIEALRLSDEEARRLAVDTSRSYIVQAPAGSGKTSLLTQRFLKLLSVVDKPEDILAITFTNKAVGEMRERILDCLKEASSHKQCPQDVQYKKDNWLLASAALKRDRQKNWHLLDNPARLRIRTIDSFCNYIAQNLPISSGMGYSLETDSDSYKYYYQAAVKTVNALLYNEDEQYADLAEELQDILVDYDNSQSQFEEALAKMLEQRSDFVKIFDAEVFESSSNYAALYRESFAKSSDGGATCGITWPEEKLREKTEANYRQWRDGIIADLEQTATTIDYDFCEVVERAARALILEHNSGCEDKIKQADKEAPTLVYALAGLADSQLFSEKDKLEAWQKWQWLSIVLLNSSKDSFRKQITATSLRYNGNQDQLSGITKQSSKKNYYQDWINFADSKSQSSLLSECDNCEQRDEFIELLQLASDFGPDRYTDEQWQKIAKVLHILAFAIDNLHQVFAQEMKCDYAEISRAALQASDPYNANGIDKFSVENPIKHILVDEYQDTSWEQYKLLINLTCNWSEGEGRTVFCVGDPMQSTYRFRGADVSVYTHTKEVGIRSEYNSLKLNACTLHQNFRSVVNLIEELGHSVFQHIFPETGCSSKGTVQFSPSIAPPDKISIQRPITVEPIISFNEAERGKLESQGLKIAENYDPSVYEAELIVAKISQLRQQEPEASCAVLLEQKNLGGHILQALQEKNIPVSQKDILKLQEAEPVPLLMAITKIILDPLDRPAWIMLLRSPLLGLTWQDICAIAERYIIKDKDTIKYSCPGDFWSALGKFVKNKQAEANLLKRCRSLYLAFKAAFKERRSFTLARSVECLWRSLGGPAYYRDIELKVAQQYLDFLNKYNESNTWPTSDSLDDDLNDLYADTLTDIGNPVQFLTIHGAKGLEFDYVFIPGLGKKRKRNHSVSMLEHASVIYDNDFRSDGGNNSMLLSYGREDTPIGRAVKNLADNFDERERVRLFYVAATRAKKRLFIYTYIKFTFVKGLIDRYCVLNSGKILNGRLLDSLSKFFPEQFSKVADAAALGQIYFEKCQAMFEAIESDLEADNKIPRLKVTWSQECGLEKYLRPVKFAEHKGLELVRESNSLSSGGTSNSRTAEKFVRKVSDHSIKAQLGTIIHYAFEQLAQYPPIKAGSWDTEEIVTAFKPVVDKMCAEEFSESRRQKLADRAYLAIRQLLNSEKGRWILRCRSQANCELAFYAHKQLLQGACGENMGTETCFEVEKRILDRCFVEGDTFWIVDYKTSCLHTGETAADFYKRKTNDYREQLIAYKNIVAECFPQYRGKIRTALYFPLAFEGEAFCEIVDSN